MAYSSDIGESFRPVANPAWVNASYGLAVAYILGDVAYHGYQAKEAGKSTSVRLLFMPNAQMYKCRMLNGKFQMHKFLMHKFYRMLSGKFQMHKCRLPNSKCTNAKCQMPDAKYQMPIPAHHSRSVPQSYAVPIDGKCAQFLCVCLVPTGDCKGRGANQRLPALRIAAHSFRNNPHSRAPVSQGTAKA